MFLKNAPPSSFCFNRPSSYGSKKFFCSNVIICSSLYLVLVFAIHSHDGHLVHVTWTIYTNFRSIFLRMRHMKFGIDWPSGFLSLDDDNDDDDGRRSMGILH